MLTQIIEGSIMTPKLDDIVMRTGETNRIIIFRLLDGKGEAITAEDYSMEFIMQKPDGNFVIQTLGTITDGFYLHTVEQMAAAGGVGYYTLRITDNDDLIYTAHGSVIVDDNTLSDGVIESISEVNGLRFPDDFLTTDSSVAMIDDSDTSTETTWSSNKIAEEISADVSKTVTGNPVEFSDGASSPISSCILSVQGYQEGSGIATAENVRTVHSFSGNTVRVEDIDESGTDYAMSYPVNMFAGYINFFSKTYTCNKLVINLNTAGMNNTDSAPGWNNCGITDIVGAGHYIIQNIAICNICNKYTIDTMFGNDLIMLENTGKTQTQLIAMSLDVQIVVELSAPQFGDIDVSPYPIKTLKGYNKITADAGTLTVEYVTEDYSPITKLIPDPQDIDTEIHYSTTEQRIGTWIDGSPVYERTFTGLSTNTNGTSWVTIPEIDISEWGEIIDTKIYRNMNNKYAALPIAEFGKISSSNNIAITVVSSVFNSTITMAICRYTKTTDT